MRPIAIAAIVLMYAVPFLSAQSYTFTPLDPHGSLYANEIGKQIPGCSCHMGKGYAYNGDRLLEQIFLNPTAVQTEVNQSVQIRYDASAICGGQTIRDSDGNPYGSTGFKGLGTIHWEPGEIQPLPEGLGLVTCSGYSHAKYAQITVSINVQCYDTGAESVRGVGFDEKADDLAHRTSRTSQEHAVDDAQLRQEPSCLEKDLLW